MELSTLTLLAAGCLALALPLLAWAFTASPGAARKRALDNLNRDFLGGPAADAGPVVAGGGAVAAARRLTPTGLLKLIDKMHARAGRPAAWPLERIIVSKLVLTAAVGALVFLVVSKDPSLRAVVIGFTFTAVAWLLPELLLYNVGQKRRSAVEKSLPDTLDQLTIAVDAGLGFEAAMSHVARNSRGPLAEEIIRTLQDMQVGQSRREAYRDLAERVDVKDLRRFVNAVSQADKHGLSIAGVLRTQADEMRLKRRQRAEEKAMQIPVKVVFPLILFILPVLFIVVMGPGVIGIIEAFSK